MAEMWRKWMEFGIWNKNQSRNKIWEKSACPALLTFFQILDKNTGLGIWNWFGTDLAIPNIWVFGHLDQN
jgi:hypothetical protein